jgi:hypothetical protein
MPSHGDGRRPPAYNQDMQLQRAPVKRAPLDDQHLSADPVRTAATLILLGSACQIFRLFMPWVERALFSITLVRFDLEVAAIILAALATVAAVIAVFALLRPPPTAATAIVMVVLASAQLGVAVWHSLSILSWLQHSPHVWADAIGTGMYLGVIGAVTSLAGAFLMWTNRAGRVALR